MNSTDTNLSRQGANSIAEDLELKIRSGQLGEGDRLPSIRELAGDLGVSPATVSSAYGRLRARGLIAANRSGTVVAPLPELGVRTSSTPELAGIDVSEGNPDPRLFPDLGTVGLGPDPLLYTESQDVAELAELGRRMFADDGVPSDHIAIVGGSHDGVERALADHLLAGDRVAVEDPGYAGTHDLVRAMGLARHPVGIDSEGMLPDSLQAAIRSGAKAVVITNRAQNATGAALTEERSQELRSVLADHPEVLLIEDDHAGPVAGAQLHTLAPAHPGPWVAVRSFGKYLAPDLRVALLVGDELTVGRVKARQLVGTGWVSQILQRLAIRGLTDAGCVAALAAAENSYRERRESFVGLLAERGIEAPTPSGFNVWIPVERETEVWAGLLARGWIAAPGSDFRIEAPPGIRVTLSPLDVDQLEPLADAVAEAVSSRRRVL